MTTEISLTTTEPTPIQAKGLVFILQKKKILASGGNSAYFLGRDDLLFSLYRQGVWPTSDSFFYPFSGKECTLIGEVYGSCKINVQSIKIIGEGYLMDKYEHLLPKHFEPIPDIPKLLFQENTEIKLVQNISNIYDSEASRLYLKVIKHNKLTLYFRISLTQVELFLSDRISLLELIRLREDEMIFSEQEIKKEIKNTVEYPQIKKDLDEFMWDLLFFKDTINLSDHQTAKEIILQKLQSITKNGIIGIYKNLWK